MIELIVVALVGSIIAGLWDLKTTEVPDEVPALMIVFGIFLWYVRASFYGEFSGLFLSLFIGTLLLAFGLILYRRGQWGGADAWILAAIGYLIPIYNGRIFMADYIFNFLIISAVYMIVYALILGILNPKLFSRLTDELKIRWKIAFGVPLVFAVFSLSLVVVTGQIIVVPVLTAIALVVLLTIFWVYAKVVEKYAFRKKIPTSKLKAGDVLEEMIWRGITAEEAAEIRKKKKFVVVKEGVRFVPVFPITLVLTLLYGNLFFLILG